MYLSRDHGKFIGDLEKLGNVANKTDDCCSFHSEPDVIQEQTLGGFKELVWSLTSAEESADYHDRFATWRPPASFGLASCSRNGACMGNVTSLPGQVPM